ncbi:MAG: hypothetical protein WAV48_06705 [Candidatus Magasanikiibacteriota bacterium]
MTPQQNIQAVEYGIIAVKAHPMCLRFHELTDASAYRVDYPDGYWVGAVQATYTACGKLVALNRLLAAMERHWQESKPGYKVTPYAPNQKI